MEYENYFFTFFSICTQRLLETKSNVSIEIYTDNVNYG